MPPAKGGTLPGMVSLKTQWWAVQDLNLRPLACEASALPLS